MNFEDLRVFIQVASLESFSRAATRLRVAQPALSRRIRRLETTLGTPLLTRHGRGVRPTEAGILLLAKAEELLLRLKQVEDEVITGAKEPTGHLRLALPPITGQMLAPSLIERFRGAYPKVTLHLLEGFSGYIEDWLANGSVDLAVLYNPKPGTGLLIEPLLEEPLFLIVPTRDPASGRPLRYPRKAKLELLAQKPLILPGRSYGLRRLVDRLMAEQGFHPNIVLEVDGMRITNRLVERGLGYTVFSYAGAYPEVAQGSLRTIPFDLPHFHWTLALASRVGLQPLAAAAAALRRGIEQEVRRLVDKGLWRGRLPPVPE